MASADRQMIGDATLDRRGAKVMQGALAPFDAHMAAQLRVTARAGHERGVAARGGPGAALRPVGSALLFTGVPLPSATVWAPSGGRAVPTVREPGAPWHRRSIGPDIVGLHDLPPSL